MEAGDATLVAQAKAGDGDAFRVLVERHSRKIFRLAFRLTGNEPDAEDVVQETFLKAYRNLETFDERAVFSTWVFRIATNQSLDLLRSRQVKKTQELVEEHASPALSPGQERLVFSGQMQERIAEVLNEMSPLERTAFTLRHLEGQTIEEISEVLKIGGNAAKHSIFRAVQKLRRTLEPLGGKSAWRT